jgi:predicted O-methyltransferase YrrM
MELLKNLASSASVVPLVVRLGRLDSAPTPDALVDLSLGHSAIAPLQVRTEFLALSELVAAQRPRAILEIGTFRGGTLVVFSRLAAPDAVVVSLDLPVSAMGKLYRLAQVPLFHQFVTNDQTLHLLREDSHRPETMAHVAEILQGRPLDFLFIDGDHSYEGVKADFDLHSPLVKPGGMVAFHDIAYPPCGVPQYWDEVKARYRHTEFIHKHGPKAMGIGVLWM